MTYNSPIRQILIFIVILNLPTFGYSEVCQHININQQIHCLKELGVSVDEFTEAYLRWVTDLKTQLEKFNQEEAKCSILRWRAERYREPDVLSEIQKKCEGPLLEDRLQRFNAMKNNYIVTKQRYEQIKQYYAIARELLDILETRQQQLENEYSKYEQHHPANH
ncbi:hypothetical protein TI03_02970 [Achromatium sp. WMS1]|nr:hypothetical protein TI03_02970 [Achromatium sp. WMS1]